LSWRILVPAVLAFALTAAPAPAAVGDDLVPALSIADVRVGETDQVARLTITASAPAGPLGSSASIATASGTAAEGQDFSSVTGRVALPPGATSTTIDVPIADDADDEDDETFTVTLSAPVGATIARPTATVTITSDDVRTLTVGDVAVTEGTGENVIARVPVMLDRPTFRTVTVRWATADGSATAPRDYLARLSQATIAPGQTRVLVEIPVVSDDTREDIETFGVGLAAEADGARIVRGDAVVTVADDDVADKPAVSGDSTAPRMGLSRARLSTARSIRVLVACPRSEERCRGRLTLFAQADRRGRVQTLRDERLGVQRFSLPGNASRLLTFRVPAGVARVAARNRRLKVQSFLVARDGAGNLARRSRATTLRPRASTRRR
jgi:hypothetical protein